MSDPGELAGQEGSHVPKVEIKGRKATISVEHEMKGEHWVMYIWADDENGKTIDALKLKHTDTPCFEITLPEGVREVTAFECCDLHGLWRADPVAVA